MTIGKLIEKLSEYNNDTKVIVRIGEIKNRISNVVYLETINIYSSNYIDLNDGYETVIIEGK